MKKFDPDKELSKVQNKNQSNFNASKINNMYVPILVIACSLLTFVGITFSANIVDDDKGEYSVKVAIVGNEDATYEIIGADDLNKNSRKITIEVKAQDGTKTKYTISLKSKNNVVTTEEEKPQEFKLENKLLALDKEARRGNPEMEAIEKSKWTGEKMNNMTDKQFDRLQRDEGR